MKNYSLILVALVLSLGFLLPSFAQQPEEMNVEGVLASLDDQTKTFVVKVSDEQELQSLYKEETRITLRPEAEEAVRFESLKERVGARFRVTYRMHEGKAEAVRIELAPMNP